MAKAVRPIPEGHHAVTPHIVVRGAAKAIDFYQRAFGAEEVFRMAMPGSDHIMHAEVKIGGSHVFLADEFDGENCPGGGPRSPQALGGTSLAIHLYVNDVDAVFASATAAGATVVMPVTDMFWGDRFGQVKDPFGHCWSIATHKEDVPPEEMGQRAAACFAGMGK